MSLPFLFSSLAVPSLEIVHCLEDSSRILQRLCRADCADTPLRRHADTVVIFGCGSAALCLGVLASWREILLSLAKSAWREFLPLSRVLA
jgi:hypothetical protein